MMLDNTPGFDWAGDVRADYGDFGLPLNDTASKWDRADAPDRMWVPAHHDPSLSNAARVNYVGSVGGAGGYGTPEAFATKRSRFSYDPTLLARKRNLDANLDAIGVADGPPGDDYGGVEQTDDVEAQAWAGQPPIPTPTCKDGGREGFRGRERVEGDGLSDLFSDHNLLVLIFVLVLFLVVQAMIGGAVRAALAEGVRGSLVATPGG